MNHFLLISSRLTDTYLLPYILDRIMKKVSKLQDGRFSVQMVLNLLGGPAIQLSCQRPYQVLHSVPTKNC